MGNPLVELQRFGQSPWHDNIRRSLLTSGALAKMVKAGDITGLTSNPTIFEQAIAKSTDYDEALRAMAAKGKSAEEIVDTLIVEDIRAAADVFKPVFERTAGNDGFVSIEVAPAHAHDTATTIREAARLWRTVKRPNLMVKIPATVEGIPAIEHCIAEGININVTLIFSLERYDEVMEAYLRGLERRLGGTNHVRGAASVASFFVSRVDTAIDKLLEEKIATAGPDQAAQLVQLKGKAAIANAKLAYAAFKRKFATERFQALAARGARLQRPLWASTSTKNPDYPDVFYVEALIGPNTVDTMPPATLVAYKDHGRPEPRLERDPDEAAAALQRLEDAGISMADVTAQLEVEGVASFRKSFESLVAVVAAWREAFLFAGRTSTRLGKTERAVTKALSELDEAKFAERLWNTDPTLWKPDDPGHQEEIRRRLGWLDVTVTMQAKVGELEAFAAEVRGGGFTHAVLCGMGGSSLAPEVLRETIGTGRGGLDLTVLDSTDPATVAQTLAAADPARTLYVIASKSGGTTEVDAFMRFFWGRVSERSTKRTGEHFVAITDPGTTLESRAREQGFRRVFKNPTDIGGRYSALSYFGLVPAALMGIDIARLVERAEQMRLACGPAVSAAYNPGLRLGAAIGALARRGRDKLTLILPPDLAAFGYWIEQLIAESTGKEGKGIVPVEGEPLGAPSAYGKDRLFVAWRSGARSNGTAAHARAAEALARAGHPVLAFQLRDPYDLGAEFMRWEIATATAGFLLGIDPFDQPNVQESKDNTGRLLAEYRERGALPDAGGALTVDAPDFPRRLRAHCASARRGDYVALTAYVERTPRREALLAALRAAIRDRFKVATTVGFGPRYLHSTGQLHKGGAATGVFVQLISDDPADLAIPGERYTFGTLKAAQAVGDYQALVARGRRVLRVALGRDVEAGLMRVVAGLESEGGRTRSVRPRGVRTRPARKGNARRGRGRKAPRVATARRTSKGRAAR